MMADAAVLEERLSGDPFDFSDITLPAEAEKMPGASLETMLNEYVAVGKFWARAPKLRQQKTILAIVQAAQENETEAAMLEAVVTVASQVLSVREGARVRSATPAEIEEAFSLEEVAQVIERFVGLKRGGNGAGE